MNSNQLSKCVGKDPLDRSTAKQVAARVRTRRGCNVAPYKCTFCGQWHVGSAKLKKAERSRR